MKTLVWVVGLWASVAAFADAERGFWMQPCSNWRFDGQSGTYGCSILGFQQQMYDRYDVDQLINRLEQKIEALEARVKTLENGKP